MVILLSLRSHFEQMEKPILRDVYARTFSLKGLVNNTLLLKELLKFYEGEVRLSELFESWDSLQKRVFSLIAYSGERGLRFRELRLAVPVGQINSLKSFLTYLCENFIVWKTQGEQENVVYRVFFDSYVFAMKQQDFQSEKPRGQLFSYDSLLDYHVSRLASFLKLGKLKATTLGDLQRRSMQWCEQSITHSLVLSSKAPSDEVMLILQFFLDSGWIVKTEDSQLFLADSVIPFLNKNGFRLHQEIFHWWLKTRFNSEKKMLGPVLELLKQPVSVSKVVEYFWPLDPCVRLGIAKTSIPFDQLPRPLRELWFLGIVDFYVNRNYEIESVVCNCSGKDRSEKVVNAQNANISALPNFEFVIPTSVSPRVLFYASCFAIPENDESILRFRLERENFLEALKADFSEQEVRQFFSWLNPPANVLNALEEWAAVFFGASIFTARILKIVDKSIFDDLCNFPQFMEFIVAPIPEYGFLIRPECEFAIRELLVHYGLTPAFDRDLSSLQTVESFSWSNSFATPFPQEQTPNFLLEVKSKDSSTIENGKKNFGEDFQQFDISGLVKALRYAKTSETLFVARISDSTRKTAKVQEKTFSVQSLRLSQMPFIAKVVELGKDVEQELDLSHIRELKLLHKKKD